MNRLIFYTALIFVTGCGFLSQNDFMFYEKLIELDSETEIGYKIYQTGIDNYRYEFYGISGNDTTLLFEAKLNDATYKIVDFGTFRINDSVFVFSFIGDEKQIADFKKYNVELCSSKNEDYAKIKADSKWNEIKTEQDFGRFFEFALDSANLEQHPSCVDSLDKYVPQKNCIILIKSEYFREYDDSIVSSSFFVYDKCGDCIDYNYKNIFQIDVLHDDRAIACLGDDFGNYKEFLITILDSCSDAEYMPEQEIFEINDKEYCAKKLGVLIYCDMLPDTSQLKTSWTALLKTTNEVLVIFEDKRNRYSEEIFNKEFDDLSETQRDTIIMLVPKFIEIRFDEMFSPPPPPPN